MKYGDEEFSQALSEMYRTDERRGIQVRLLDGTDGCYITFVPAASFEPATVARAAGEALAMFIDGYRRDERDRDETYDPVEWSKKVEAWRKERQAAA